MLLFQKRSLPSVVNSSYILFVLSQGRNSMARQPSLSPVGRVNAHLYLSGGASPHRRETNFAHSSNYARIRTMVLFTKNFTMLWSFALVFLVAFPLTQACSCQPLDMSSRFFISDVMFRGLVTRVVRNETSRYDYYFVQPTQVYKGCGLPSEYRLADWTISSCSFPLQNGTSYIFPLGSTDRKQTITLCNVSIHSRCHKGNPLCQIDRIV